MSMSKVLNNALNRAMAEDERIFCIGEDIGLMNGTFGVTAGLLDTYGEKRVIDTPISEAMFMGAAVGAAACGLVPVVEIMFADFVSYCFDQIVNQAAKMRYMYGGNIEMPIVIRMPGGGGVQSAAQHSQSLEGLFTHIPGLKVVMPSCPSDARGLLLSSIADRNPVMFFETKSLYSKVEKLEDEYDPIPLGSASVKREGSDVTIVATGASVFKASKAAEVLASEGVESEIIDPRTLYPLDYETIFKSLKKTGKLLIVTEECKRGAWSAEVAAEVSEKRFDLLKAPILRIGSLNTPAPLAKQLEDYYLPRVEDLVDGVRSICK
jgi:pyruvate dehydrogenase E1 component beta subunit